jgi:hypothetical protein
MRHHALSGHSCRSHLRLRSAVQWRGVMPNAWICKDTGRVSPCGACPDNPHSIRPSHGEGAGRRRLTPEYRAIFEASLADQAKGSEGNSRASGIFGGINEASKVH